MTKTYELEKVRDAMINDLEQLKNDKIVISEVMGKLNGELGKMYEEKMAYSSTYYASNILITQLKRHYAKFVIDSPIQRHPEEYKRKVINHLHKFLNGEAKGEIQTAGMVIQNHLTDKYFKNYSDRADSVATTIGSKLEAIHVKNTTEPIVVVVQPEEVLEEVVEFKAEPSTETQTETQTTTSTKVKVENKIFNVINYAELALGLIADFKNLDNGYKYINALEKEFDSKAELHREVLVVSASITSFLKFILIKAFDTNPNYREVISYDSVVGYINKLKDDLEKSVYSVVDDKTIEVYKMIIEYIEFHINKVNNMNTDKVPSAYTFPKLGYLVNQKSVVSVNNTITI